MGHHLWNGITLCLYGRRNIKITPAKKRLLVKRQTFCPYPSGILLPLKVEVLSIPAKWDIHSDVLTDLGGCDRVTTDSHFPLLKLKFQYLARDEVPTCSDKSNIKVHKSFPIAREITNFYLSDIIQTYLITS